MTSEELTTDIFEEARRLAKFAAAIDRGDTVVMNSLDAAESNIAPDADGKYNGFKLVVSSFCPRGKVFTVPDTCEPPRRA